MATLPSVRLLTDAVAALLADAPGVTLYRSRVDPKPPADPGGTVRGYWVLHPQPGTVDSDNLTAQPGQLLWGFQLTCAGGDDNYAGHAIDLARERLDGRTLTVAGARVGLLQPPLGYRPPPLLEDRDVTPSRLFTSLLYDVLTVLA